MMELNNPVGVFDAGIGSLGVVDTVHKHCPNQDVIWLADRESFPLGKKTTDALLEIGKKGIGELAERGATSIIVAANVLSMMVLDQLKAEFPDLKLYGIMPPVEEAAQHGNFCILGVKAMVEDSALRNYVEQQDIGASQAFFANASPLIDELVETGVFVEDPNQTVSQVKDYMVNAPDVPAYTLSSTHLPWLKFAFEAACPDKVFLDPADRLVAQMELPNDGNGQVLALTSENIELDMTAQRLQSMLNLLNRRHIIPQVL